MRVWRRQTSRPGNAVSASGLVVGSPANPVSATLITDTALSHPSRDRLSRAGFAQRLAQTMTERGQAGSVVGLFADWGEGKSTVLGFVEHYLDRQTSPVVVVRFNPWFDSDESAVIRQFFAAVAGALGVDLRKRREKLGAAVRKVNPFLKAVDPSVGPADGVTKEFAQSVDFKVGPVPVSGLMEVVGNLLGEPTLRNLRDRLRALLTAEAQGQNRRVVVLIDDIDRLEAAQVATVFRMIKLAADFPMLSVLTAFAPLPVAQALGARFGGGDDLVGQGNAFLEKIVQVPVWLPPADPALVTTLMQDLLGQVINARCGTLPAAEQARLETAMDRCVWPFVRTLRLGKQLLSKVDFVLPVMQGEINPCDQVILQALELLHPALYRFIATNKPLMVHRPEPEPFRTARAEQLNRALDDLPPASQGSAKKLLQLLFPHLQSLFGNTWHAAWQEEEWARAKRVCSPSYFSRFFAFGLPVGDILDAEIEAILNVPWPGNQAPLAALLTGQESNLAVQKLTEHSTGLSPARSLDLARALAASGTNLSASGGLPFEPAFRVGALLSRLLRATPSPQRAAAAHEVLELAEPGLAAIAMLAFEASGEDIASPGPLLDAAALREVGTRLVGRWAQMTPTEVFGTGAGTVQTISVWFRYGDPQQARNQLVAALNASTPLLLLLLHGYLPGASGGPQVTMLDRSGYQGLLQMMPASEWAASVELHFPGLNAIVQQAVTGTLSSEERPLTAAAGTVPASVGTFLFIHHSAVAQAPPTPVSVFEPTLQRRSHVSMQTPRHLLGTSEPARPALVLRACVVRPGELLNTGERASTIDEATRRALLGRLLDSHNPSRTLMPLLNGTPWNITSPPIWEHTGGAGREVDTFAVGDSNDITTRGFGAHVAIRTGYSAAMSGTQQLPAIMGTTEFHLLLSEGRVLTLVELRNLLVDAMTAVSLTRKAADELLPVGPFDEGELGLWLATNAPQGLQEVIDLGPAAPGASSLPEVELHSDLSRWPSQTSTAGHDSEVQLLAVELIGRCFLRSNRRDYEVLLRSLLT